MGFGFWGLKVEVWDLGFGVWVWELGCWDKGSGFGVHITWFRIKGLEFTV